MTRSSKVFKLGTRASKLALLQTGEAQAAIKELIPEIGFETVEMCSPGDRDRETDLKKSPQDFFTRDLDEAILKGEIDCAIHSAKDLPNPMPDEIDWFWLPAPEIQNDTIVLAPGKTLADLPEQPVIGVSSERREAWCKEHFPNARIKSIRGNVEERLSQLDAGDYDILITAVAALMRLGLLERASQWIPTEELPPPDGQGYLAFTFKADNKDLLRLRSLFVKSVTFAGAGIGTADNTTLGAIKALQNCDACIYDSLMPPALLDYLPVHAKAIDAGKRCGDHHMDQDQINKCLADLCRQGKRVVRLKGGDPGIFGRLAEEVETLDTLQLPYRVLPGVSSLNVATTGTGMLLTRRGTARGFCAITPRQRGGGLASVASEARNELPIAFFMAGKAVDKVVSQLLEDGMDPETPAALVYSAGMSDEEIVKGTISETGNWKLETRDQPAILLVGDITKHSYAHHGALGGQRILLTCSEALQDKASLSVTDFGGRPIPFPLIRLSPTEEPFSLRGYEWVVLTSPSAARCMCETIEDLRDLPRILVCGAGTDAELRKHGLVPDVTPLSGYSAQAVVDIIGGHVQQDAKVLRLRSDKAGPQLAEEIRKTGAEVDDHVLYTNKPIFHKELPEFDSVFFASSSAVESFISQFGKDALKNKTILAIGKPTAEALEKNKLPADVIGREATVESAIQTLAIYFVNADLS